MKKLSIILFALLFGTSLYANETNKEQPTEKSVATAETEEITISDDELDEEDDEEELFEKVGFLTTEDCALKGSFSSCYTESYVCGFEGCYKENEPGTVKPVQLVLFVHNDGKYYKVELADNLKKYQLDAGIGRNEVTIIGQYDEEDNIIYASDFKAPPPPKASFFKGCL